MRGVIGFTVLTIGLGFAAYSYAPDMFESADTRLSFASSAANAATIAIFPETGRLSDFSPGSGLARAPLTVTSSSTQNDEVGRLRTFSVGFADAQAQRAPVTLSAAAAPVELKPWRSAVLVDPTGVGPNGKEVRAQFLSAEQRLLLITALQGELMRVGCYGGEASGSWTAETRAALAAFMDRVNAVLPIDEPDFTLLELVKAHPRSTCDASCPDGQSFEGHGRCVPLAVLTQTHRPRVALARALDPAEAAALSLAAPRSKAPLIPQPMALGAGSLASAPVRPEPQRRIAQVETGEDLLTPGTTKSLAELPPVKKKAARKAEAAPRQWSSYRHVQRLFEHPLGRL